MLPKQVQKNRILVPLKDEGAVIPKALFRLYGHVLLPEKWTKAAWKSLSREEKVYLYRCVADFHFWFRWVFLPHKAEMELGMSEEELDETYKDGLPEFMVEYFNDIQAACPLSLLASDNKPEHSDVWRLCRVFGTGMFKSTITCEGWPLFLVGINPGVSIIIAVRTKDKAEKFIDVAKSHIERSERYKWVHGDLRSDGGGKWRNDCIVVDRKQDRVAPTIEICGYEGAIEGQRYDLGIGDDLADFTNTKTDAARNNLEQWVDGPLYTRLNPRTRMLMLIGTPHGADDLYARKKREAGEEGTWDYKEVPLIRSGTWPPPKIDPAGPWSRENIEVPDDLVSAWPQWWTVKNIIEDFLNSPASFARTRMCKVRDPATKWFPWDVLERAKADGRIRESDGFQKPLLSRWPVQIGIPDEESFLWDMYTSAGFDIPSMTRVISVDLAATNPEDGQDPDFTVFQLWAHDKGTHARILLNQFRRQTGDPKVIENALREWVWSYKPHKLLVEAHAVDKLYARTLQDVIGCPVTIRVWRENKSGEIEAFRDLVESGLTWVPWARDSFGTHHTFASFLQELYDWPDTVHDDTLTAAVHAYMEMRGGGGSATARVIGGDAQQQTWTKHSHDSVGVAGPVVPKATSLRPKSSMNGRRMGTEMKEAFLRQRIGGRHHVW